MTDYEVKELFDRAARLVDRCGTVEPLSEGDYTKRYVVEPVHILRLYARRGGPYREAIEIRVMQPASVLYRVITAYLDGARADINLDYVRKTLSVVGPGALETLRQHMVLDDLAEGVSD